MSKEYILNHMTRAQILLYLYWLAKRTIAENTPAEGTGEPPPNAPAPRSTPPPPSPSGGKKPTMVKDGVTGEDRPATLMDIFAINSGSRNAAGGNIFG